MPGTTSRSLWRAVVCTASTATSRSSAGMRTACMTEDYVELGLRSAFSFLEGASLPEELVERAAALGHGTLALADAHGLYGMPRFALAAEQAGIRALVGARVALRSEGAVARRSVPPPETGRVVLLVQSREGYRNLCRLLTLGHAA